MKWSLPAALPSTGDLRQALAVLEAQSAPATMQHMAWCFAKLMMAFEPTTKLTKDETKLRVAVWAEACADLGDQLWSAATLALIQSSKWMPKPAEFRKAVEAKFEERAKRLRRCKAMLDAQQAGQPTTSKPTKRSYQMTADERRAETISRLRDAIPVLRRHMPAKAAERERELAAFEGREPESWAFLHHPERPQTVQETAASAPAPLPQSAGTKAAMLRARADFWRRQPGGEARADRLERELADAMATLAHPDEPAVAAA